MAEDRSTFVRLEQLPNVGKATAGDFRLLGITEPGALIGRDPYALFDALCTITKQRQDPCVIDVFLATVRFMEGAPAAPWWKYTPERKAEIARRAAATG